MIVLDTHAILWLGENPGRLSGTATQAVRQTLDAGERLMASTVSLYEIAWAILRGRIASALPVRELLYSIERRFTVIAPTSDITLAAAQLPPTFPSDPCDRIIAATALASGARLITADERIRRSGAVRTVW